MTVFENIAFGFASARGRSVGERRFARKSTSCSSLFSCRSGRAASLAALRRPAPTRRARARARGRAERAALDEPFGALDAKVRQELRRWLRQLHDEVHITSVFVTHDQEEALEVADRVAVMNEGKIVQIGTPDEVFDHPATSFVFNFLGNVNLFHGRVDGGTTHIHPDATDHIVFVRPHLLDIAREAPATIVPCDDPPH